LNLGRKYEKTCYKTKWRKTNYVGRMGISTPIHKLKKKETEIVREWGQQLGKMSFTKCGIIRCEDRRRVCFQNQISRREK